MAGNFRARVFGLQNVETEADSRADFCARAAERGLTVAASRPCCCNPDVALRSAVGSAHVRHVPCAIKVFDLSPSTTELEFELAPCPAHPVARDVGGGVRTMSYRELRSKSTATRDCQCTFSGKRETDNATLPKHTRRRFVRHGVSPSRPSSLMSAAVRKPRLSPSNAIRSGCAVCVSAWPCVRREHDGGATMTCRTVSLTPT